ncbi:MAG: helix-turn-helix domain-containing protein [Deltaproteobacteria bacterium]|nr:helix-turn-helix domain-containing protein [Deltaproteobacteria bacterium]
MKSWLRKYRTHGFQALKPKDRSDSGRPRRLNDQHLKAIEIKCKAYPYWTVQKLYENLRDQNLLGDPPIHYNTLLRIVTAQRCACITVQSKPSFALLSMITPAWWWGMPSMHQRPLAPLPSSSRRPSSPTGSPKGCT